MGRAAFGHNLEHPAGPERRPLGRHQSGAGAYGRSRGTATRVWAKKDGLGGDNVRWLAETSDGSIWAATKPGALARIEIRLPERLPSQERPRGFPAVRKTCLSIGATGCGFPPVAACFAMTGRQSPIALLKWRRPNLSTAAHGRCLKTPKGPCGSPTGRLCGACEMGSGANTAEPTAAHRSPVRDGAGRRWIPSGCGIATTRVWSEWKFPGIELCARPRCCPRTHLGASHRVSRLRCLRQLLALRCERGDSPPRKLLDGIHHRGRVGFEHLRRGGLLERFGWQCLAGHRRRIVALPSRQRQPTGSAGCFSHHRAARFERAGPNSPGGVFVAELQGRAARTVRLPAGRRPLDRFDGAEHLHHRTGTRHAQT